MADSSPPLSRSTGVPLSRSRSSRLATHRFSARSRRSHSSSTISIDKSPSRGRQSPSPKERRNSLPGKHTSSTHAAATARSARPIRNPFPQTFFGIPQERPANVGNFEFEQKYPEDARYQEQGTNARVWRVYQDEAEVFDADMVSESRDSLDVHLVFAGLFSAVLTTFVVQTSQSLTTNFSAISTSVLIEIALVLRAQTNGLSLDSIPITVPTTLPSSLDVWVNGLWFVSLTLSLGAALLAVLVKQWLRQYMSIISGTVRDRSHIRQYRYDGLQKWHVLTFVAVMPIILHVAVGLFLAGLVLFLIPLRPIIAVFVGSITLLVYGTYIVTNILPLFRTQCPYRTPFSDVLNVLRHVLRPLFKPKSQKSFTSLRETERSIVTADAYVEEVGVGALEWLMAITSNPPTKSIVLESLGGFSPAMTARLQASCFEIPDDLVLKELTVAGSEISIALGSEGKVARLLQSRLHFPLSNSRTHHGGGHAISGVTDPSLRAVMLVSNFLPPVEARSRLSTTRFLEAEILAYDDHEGLFALPRLVWDALVQTVIPENKLYNKSGMHMKLFNPETVFRLCEIICPTFNIPASSALASQKLLPIGYALDDLIPYAIHSTNKYPKAHRLAAILAVSDYLSTINNPSDSGLRMVLEVWHSLQDIIRIPLHDAYYQRLLREKAAQILQSESSILNPTKWNTIPDQYHTLLAQCWYAILNAYHQLSISYDIFLREPFTLSTTTIHSILDRCSGGKVLRLSELHALQQLIIELWVFALNCNHPDAYNAVLEENLLGECDDAHIWALNAKRIVSFVSGITRQQDSARYIECLMRPEELLRACWMLAAAEVDHGEYNRGDTNGRGPSDQDNRKVQGGLDGHPETNHGGGRSRFPLSDSPSPTQNKGTLERVILELIRISPQNPSWVKVRKQLGKWLQLYPLKEYVNQLYEDTLPGIHPPPIPVTRQAVRDDNISRRLRRDQNQLPNLSSEGEHLIYKDWTYHTVGDSDPRLRFLQNLVDVKKILEDYFTRPVHFRVHTVPSRPILPQHLKTGSKLSNVFSQWSHRTVREIHASNEV